MTSKKDILRLVSEQSIPAVLIGDLALRIYNSPRVTHDMEGVTEIMYRRGFSMIKEVDEQHAYVHLQPQQALQWLESSSASSMTFVEIPQRPTRDAVALEQIDITTQVDFLFRLSVPIMRLKERAREILIDDFAVLVASPEDLPPTTRTSIF